MNNKVIMSVSALAVNLLIIICSFLLLSCQDKTSTEAVALQLETEEKQFCHVNDSMFIPVPLELWDMDIIGDKAVFFSPGKEHFGVIYDLKGEKEIDKLGTKGKGPDEFLWRSGRCPWQANQRYDSHETRRMCNPTHRVVARGISSTLN